MTCFLSFATFSEASPSPSSSTCRRVVAFHSRAPQLAPPCPAAGRNDPAAVDFCAAPHIPCLSEERRVPAEFSKFAPAFHNVNGNTESTTDLTYSSDTCSWSSESSACCSSRMVFPSPQMDVDPHTAVRRAGRLSFGPCTQELLMEDAGDSVVSFSDFHVPARRPAVHPCRPPLQSAGRELRTGTARESRLGGGLLTPSRLHLHW